MLVLLTLLVEPIRYDFVAPTKEGSTLSIIRYTDGQAPRTIFKRDNKDLDQPLTDLQLQYSGILMDQVVNRKKTRILVPNVLVPAAVRAMEDLTIEASVIGTTGKLLYTITVPYPKVGFPVFGWIRGESAAIAVELEGGGVLTYTRHGAQRRLRETIEGLFDVPTWPMQAVNLFEPIGVDTPYQSTAQKLPDTFKRASAFMDPQENITLLWTYSRIACNWNGRKAYYSQPKGQEYGYPRPMQYPWIVARRATMPRIPPEENIGTVVDPFLESRLYLINMISGRTEELGPGIYAISLLRSKVPRR